MEIQEWLVGGAFVVGGVVYGASQVELRDVLSEELRHIEEVSQEEKPAYMDSVVQDFSDNFDGYAIPISEDTAYISDANFEAKPSYGAFTNTLNLTEQAPKNDVKIIQNLIKQLNYCSLSEMTYFTDKGWTFQMQINNKNGSHISSINCVPPTPKLRLG